MTSEDSNTFCPLILRAKEWIDEHFQEDAQWFGH